MKPLSTMALIFLSLTNFALASEHGVGNGGDVVKLADGRFVMLDTVQAKLDRANIPSAEATLRSKVEALIAPFERLDLLTYDDLRARSEKMLQDIEAYESTGERLQPSIQFLEGYLPNVADEGPVEIPAGAEGPLQMIIRTPKPVSGQREYTVVLPYWRKLPLDEKAVGVFHEAMFGRMVDQKFAGSWIARS